MTNHVRSRKLVFELHSGEDLIQGILRLGTKEQIQTAEIHATGVLRSVVFYPSFAKQALAQSSALAILHFSAWLFKSHGKLVVSSTAMVMDPGDASVRFLGGAIQKADVGHVMLSLDVFEDFFLEGQIDSQTGAAVFSRSGSSSKKEETTSKHRDLVSLASSFQPNVDQKKPGPVSDPSKMSWEMLRNVQKNAQSSAQIEPEPIHELKVGDLLDHTTFGRCHVVRVDEDQDLLVVRVPKGRLVQLSLAYLKLSPTGQEGLVQIFRAERRITK